MPHGQSEACIYCDMEKETIIYYYPMTEETAREENRYAAKNFSCYFLLRNSAFRKSSYYIA